MRVSDEKQANNARDTLLTPFTFNQRRERCRITALQSAKREGLLSTLGDPSPVEGART